MYGISKYLLSSQSQCVLSLNLSNLDLSDSFIEMIGKKNLLSPYLLELNLSSCDRITDKGIKEILKTNKLPHLIFLDLSKTNVSN